VHKRKKTRKEKKIENEKRPYVVNRLQQITNFELLKIIRRFDWVQVWVIQKEVFLLSCLWVH